MRALVVYVYMSTEVAVAGGSRNLRDSQLSRVGPNMTSIDCWLHSSADNQYISFGLVYRACFILSLPAMALVQEWWRPSGQTSAKGQSITKIQVPLDGVNLTISVTLGPHNTLYYCELRT